MPRQFVTIAAVAWCLSRGGLELALACDIDYRRQDGAVLRFPNSGWGSFPALEVSRD